MINTLKEFCDKRDKTPYRFWQETGLPRSTAYRFFKDRNAYPDSKTQEIICKTYKCQPGEFLAYIPDDEGQVDAS